MVFRLAFAKGDGDVFLVGIVHAHEFIKKVGSLSPSVLWHPSLTTSHVFIFSYAVKVETWTSLPLHTSSCVTGLLARSHGMLSPLQLQVWGPPAMPCLMLTTMYADNTALLERLLPHKELH
jgi:hypothetical protein